MNNLIQQLAEQAKKSVPQGLSVDKWIEVYNEKFAELIVQECGVAINPPVQNRNVISRGQAYDLIKQHFGVEE